jgi:hypothetical protein
VASESESLAVPLMMELESPSRLRLRIRRADSSQPPGDSESNRRRPGGFSAVCAVEVRHSLGPSHWPGPGHWQTVQVDPSCDEVGPMSLLPSVSRIDFDKVFKFHDSAASSFRAP